MQKSIDHYGVLHSVKQRAIGRLRRLHLAYMWGLLALSRFSLLETAARGHASLLRQLRRTPMGSDPPPDWVSRSLSRSAHRARRCRVSGSGLHPGSAWWTHHPRARLGVVHCRETLCDRTSVHLECVCSPLRSARSHPGRFASSLLGRAGH